MRSRGSREESERCSRRQYEAVGTFWSPQICCASFLTVRWREIEKSSFEHILICHNIVSSGVFVVVVFPFFFPPSPERERERETETERDRKGQFGDI